MASLVTSSVTIMVIMAIMAVRSGGVVDLSVVEDLVVALAITMGTTTDSMVIPTDLAGVVRAADLRPHRHPIQIPTMMVVVAVMAGMVDGAALDMAMVSGEDVVVIAVISTMAVAAARRALRPRHLCRRILPFRRSHRLISMVPI